MGFCYSVQSVSVESKPREYQLDTPLSKPRCARLVRRRNGSGLEEGIFNRILTEADPGEGLRGLQPTL